MSTYSSIETLMNSLRIQAMAQQIISNNIVNGATQGFSRQIPILAELGPVPLASMNAVTGPGLGGTGVTLQMIERVRDTFLDLQIRQEHAAAGQQQALLDAFNGIKILFPELNAVPGSGLVTAVGTFYNDFTALAATPGSGALRATLVTDAQNMTGLFNRASQTLGALQQVTDAGVRDTVSRVSNLLQQIASANARLSLATASGVSDNADLDAQDQALTSLSDLIKIDTVRMGDGQVLVMTGNAHELVRGGTAAQVVASVNAHQPQFAGFGIKDPGTGTVTDITSEITGGKLAGQVSARDGLITNQILELDELANSMITQVNLLQQAGYAQDGVTTNIPFFSVTPGQSGSEARDITVNAAIVANPGLIAASRINGNGADGDQAKSIGLLSSLLMNATVQSTGRINNLVGTIDPTAPMNQAVHTGLNGLNPLAKNSSDFLVAPAAAGTIVINGVAIPWTSADSIDTIIGKINNPALGLGVRATFDFTKQRIELFSTGPMTVYDSAGNLTAAFRMETRVQSLAPANNGIGPLDQPINLLAALSAGVQQFRTPASATGSVQFQWQAPSGASQTVVVNWNAGQTLAGVLAAINAALGGAGAPFTVGFTGATQQFTVTGSNALPASAASPLSAVQITDLSGNLSFVANLEAQPAFGTFSNALLAQVQAQADDLSSRKAIADAAVAQLQSQQDAMSKVNLDEEKARMLEFQLAYGATVQALTAMDAMLNTLINRMAAGQFSGAPTPTVLNG